MPLSTTGHSFAGSLNHFNTRDPYNTVSTRQVLEPNNPEHFAVAVKVSVGEMNALEFANAAIEDTRRALKYGSGNQEKQVKASRGESFKRTVLVYENGMGSRFPVENARTAAYFQAGNCDHMAAVNALLLASSNLNHQVSLIGASDFGHAYVEIGDSRVSNKTVISDAWPEFGRALRRKDYALLGSNPETVARFNPQYKPEVRNQLLRGSKASQSEVDRAFASARPDHPLSGSKLVNKVLREEPIYNQEHASNNLGVRYEGDRDGGDDRNDDQDFSEGAFRKRLRDLGFSPNTGKESRHLDNEPEPVAASSGSRRRRTHGGR